jgi:hypothetical protein
MYGYLKSCLSLSLSNLMPRLSFVLISAFLILNAHEPGEIHLVWPIWAVVS